MSWLQNNRLENESEKQRLCVKMTIGFKTSVLKCIPSLLPLHLFYFPPYYDILFLFHSTATPAVRPIDSPSTCRYVILLSRSFAFPFLCLSILSPYRSSFNCPSILMPHQSPVPPFSCSTASPPHLSVLAILLLCPSQYRETCQQNL